METLPRQQMKGMWYMETLPDEGNVVDGDPPQMSDEGNVVYGDPPQMADEGNVGYGDNP